MRRLSPITMGVLAVAVLVAGAALYVFIRPPSRSQSGGEPAPLPELEAQLPSAPANRPSLPPSAARAAPAVGTPTAPAPAAPVTAPAISPVSAPLARGENAPGVDGLPVNPALALAQQRRDSLIAAQRSRILQAADEQVFDTMKLSESTRAAIRRLNEQAGLSAAAVAPGAAQQGSPRDEPVPGSAPNSDDSQAARRAGLERVLGASGAAEFAASEFSAARRLRRTGPGEASRGPHIQAPLPVSPGTEAPATSPPTAPAPAVSPAAAPPENPP